MNPINELRQEHEGIKTSLEILARITQRLDAEEETAAAGDLARLLDFFTVFVDTCHHGKEEELLFPALEASGVPKEGGPIGVMLADHDSGRGHVRALRGKLAEYQAGDRSVVPEIRRHAEAYAGLLRQHIEKENKVLFPIAEDQLSDETKNSLEEGFERIETQRVGAGRHETFHRMLDELQKKYCR
ncbi:MAG: hemerythrin domain-containing protein [Syntrophobacteraceae bacterium]